MERRYIQPPRPLEVRQAEGEIPRIIGYGAVFHRAGDAGTEFRLWTNAVERIMPRAFDSALARPDNTAALFNHNPDLLLGRVSSGTLKLSVDDVGLRYEVEPAPTPTGKEVIELVRRGDIAGSSFGFAVRSETWREEDGLEIREITDVTLFDVSPVVFPAYEATQVIVRDAHDARERWRWQAEADCRAGRLAAYQILAEASILLADET